MGIGDTVIDLTESLLKHHRNSKNSQKNVFRELSSDAIEEFLDQENIPCEWWALLVGWELRQLWSLCGAYIIFSILNMMLSSITQMFVGHIGDSELAGASMATLELQGLAFWIMSGMAIAVTISCGEAYGAKKYASLGVICQQGIILHLGAAVLFSFLYWYSSTILQALGLGADIADQTQIFARGMLPQLYASALNLPMQRFLQAQNIVNPLAYIATGIFFLHLLLTWLVVDVLKYGLLEAALTLSFSWWLLVIITGLYIILSPSCQKTWTGFSANAFKGLWSFLKLSVSSICMLSFELWYSMGLVLTVGYFANPIVSVASFSICLNCLNWDLMFMLGMSEAARIRVSIELEDAHPKVARFSAIVVNVTGILISIIFSALLLICGAALSMAFTYKADVSKAVSVLIPFLAISVLLNGVQPILSGVANGIGRPGFAACFYICNYYFIGLTIGFGLSSMTSMGVAGIWCGMICGFFLQTLVLITLFVMTDWETEVDNALDRIKKSADVEILA